MPLHFNARSMLRTHREAEWFRPDDQSPVLQAMSTANLELPSVWQTIGLAE
jgi:hypothetical protein